MYIRTPDGGTGKLTIDPDRVEVFAGHVEQALAKLREAYIKGQDLVYVNRPGEDPFSPQAVRDIEQTAGEKPGGHLYANRRAQDVFQAIVDNARASLAAYHENEVRGTQRFQGND